MLEKRYGKDIPNKRNFCGGAFQDWLEVNLIDRCNGSCAWCIEKTGYHPTYHAPWEELCNTIDICGAPKVILLGGEPTLHPNLRHIIYRLSKRHGVWITTNGSRLTSEWVCANLNGLTGINISIHHYDFNRNEEITGIKLQKIVLASAIEALHRIGVGVRLNCNCIRGEIDTVEKIRNYITFTKDIGADKIRFAELRGDEDRFVDLAKILD